MKRVLALHGMTLNSASMRRQFGPLRARVEELARVDWLDAPHVCPPESVERHYRAWGLPLPDGPHLRWWNASDDGLVYEGLDETLALLRARVDQGPPPLLLGFSQGALLAAALCMLASQEAFPAIAGAIFIAGGVPRARAIVDGHHGPVDLPSLHIWGTNDSLMGDNSRRLADEFSPDKRSIVTWHGSHTLPRRGPPADALLEFLKA